MKRQLIYKRSIKLIEKYLKETPPDEVKALIEKYDKMDIQGPTFDEYIFKV